MATYKHGKNSKLEVAPQGSTTYATLAIKSCSCTGSNPAQDTTSTISGGFKEYQAGLQGMEVEFEAQWDSVLYPYATIPNIVEGQTIGFKFWVDGAVSNPTVSGSLYVEEVADKQAVENVVTFTVKGKMTGTYVTA